jgi:hypothetical protein
MLRSMAAQFERIARLKAARGVSRENPREVRKPGLFLEKKFRAERGENEAAGAQ